MEIADTVSDETSLSFAFMTGIIDDGEYKIEINGKLHKVKITTNEKSGLRKYTCLNS